MRQEKKNHEIWQAYLIVEWMTAMAFVVPFRCIVTFQRIYQYDQLHLKWHSNNLMCSEFSMAERDKIDRFREKGKKERKQANLYRKCIMKH